MGQANTLTNDDYRHAGSLLGVSPAAIKAFAKVEAPRGGFDSDGLPVILFEAHHFSRLTGGKYDASHPKISSKKWNKALYTNSNASEHARLQDAAELDRDAALQSASWGKFQVMGFNWHMCGYDTLQSFINDMYGPDEAGHLRAACGFIRAQSGGALLRALKALDWPKVAAMYNGPGYAVNGYDIKMAQAFDTFKPEFS